MLKRTKKQIRQLRGTRVLFKTEGDNIEILLAERRIATRDQGRVRAATLPACPLLRRWWGPSGHSVSEMSAVAISKYAP